MSTVGWLLVVAVGIALGFSAGRLWPGSAAKLTSLERERNAAREDLQTYRQEVSEHFERTAELFDKVTTDYRDLYEHLARSERQLGAIRGESAGSSLAQPEQRRLGANPGAAAAAESAASAAEATPPSAADEKISPGEETEPAGDSEAAPTEEDKLPDDEDAASGDETVSDQADEETVSDQADEDDAARRGQ